LFRAVRQDGLTRGPFWTGGQVLHGRPREAARRSPWPKSIDKLPSGGIDTGRSQLPKVCQGQRRRGKPRPEPSVVTRGRSTMQSWITAPGAFRADLVRASDPLRNATSRSTAMRSPRGRPQDAGSCRLGAAFSRVFSPFLPPALDTPTGRNLENSLLNLCPACFQPVSCVVCCTGLSNSSTGERTWRRNAGTN
jgi:hypothetical protein